MSIGRGFGDIMVCLAGRRGTLSTLTKPTSCRGDCMLARLSHWKLGLRGRVEASRRLSEQVVSKTKACDCASLHMSPSVAIGPFVPGGES